jgi:hypothetical protein
MASDARPSLELEVGRWDAEARAHDSLAPSFAEATGVFQAQPGKRSPFLVSAYVAIAAFGLMFARGMVDRPMVGIPLEASAQPLFELVETGAVPAAEPVQGPQDVWTTVSIEDRPAAQPAVVPAVAELPTVDVESLPSIAADVVTSSARSPVVPVARDEATPPFQLAFAEVAMGSVAGRLAACAADLEDGESTVKVRVTFASTGKVTQALVTGSFAGTAVGSCMASALRTVEVPAFEGELTTVSKTLRFR